jgi:PIN domain nuclease of toxin-antitoxin system
MRLLLDTSTFLWALRAPERLSRTASREMSKAAAESELSVVSISEIAIKHLRGTLSFFPRELEMGIAQLRLRVLPFGREHAIKMYEVGGQHRDPFDKQLIAQALAEDIPIVTCDEAFERYQGLKVIW